VQGIEQTLGLLFPKPLNLSRRTELLRDVPRIEDGLDEVARLLPFALQTLAH